MTDEERITWSMEFVKARIAMIEKQRSRMIDQIERMLEMLMERENKLSEML